MSLTLFEFTVFGIYLALMTLTILLLQIYNPGKQIRETIEYSQKEFAESVFEEPDSDSDGEEKTFDPTKETFAMTENPMLRRRVAQEEEAKPVSLEDVD